MNNQIVDALKWRYAVKKYDTTRKLPKETLETLTDSLRLSPSSNGLQPWKFLVINDLLLREKLREAAYGQPQVTEASHFIVLTRRTDINADFIEHFVASTAEIRSVTVESLAGFKEYLLTFVNQISQTSLESWASEQVHIALGFLVETAALLNVDASPMGGFDKQKFDSILGLPQKHLASVVICALGYRAMDDKYSQLAKSRFPESEVIEVL